MKLGIVAFANDSGLGAQTRRLTYMLKPDRLLVVDSTSFSKNKQQHLDWYSQFSGYKVHGFPNNREVRKFMSGLTHVILCENPLNFFLLDYAHANGIQVFIQSNYEFCDHLCQNLPLPTKFLMPSYWKIAEMKEKFGAERIEYLPPPIIPNEFKEAREINFSRSNQKTRFLHIIGTLAANDRNGTLDLLAALPYTQKDFDLIIRSQHELPSDYKVPDPRVTYQIGNIPDAQDMYRDFDALILPRRYGGLSLTTNEALMSGLPVVMTDISPNNELLPKDWLLQSRKKSEFMTRTMIDVFEVEPKAFAKKIDWLITQDFARMKIEAFGIGYDQFNESDLKPKYESLFV